MEEICQNCIYFIPCKWDPRFGFCIGEVPGKKVKATDSCILFWPKPGYPPVGGQREVCYGSSTGGDDIHR